MVRRYEMKKEKNWAMGGISILALITIWLFGLTSSSLAFGESYSQTERRNQSSRKKIEVRFKLSAGYGSLLNGAGDLDKSRKGIENSLSYIGEQEGYSTYFAWDKTSYLPNFSAEIIVMLTQNFGISLGSGFLRVPNKGKYSFSSSLSGSWSEDITYHDFETVDVTRAYKITAVPLNLDLYLLFPLSKSKKFNFFGHAGVGYYFGKLIHELKTIGSSQHKDFYNEHIEYKRKSNYSGTVTDTARCNSIGFQGGLGLEIKMSSFMSLGAEFFGRYVDFNNWKGDSLSTWQETNKYWSSYTGWNQYSYDDRDSEYGHIWTYDLLDEKTHRSFTFMSLLEKRPEGNYIKNARKASINLNSYGFSFSIQFHFGLF